MATLTQTAIITRKVIRFSLFFLVFLIVARSTLSLGIKVYKKYFPSPPPPPTVAWNKLSKIPFPEKAATSLSYKLETPDGNLPLFPTQLKVYFIPRPVSNHLALDFAKDKAKALGFSTEAKEKSDPVYQFSHPSKPSTLEYNTVTNIFSVGYDLAANPSAIERRPPAPEIAVSRLKSYLSSAKLLPDDLSGPVSHEFLRFEESKLVNVLSLSEANLVKVHLFRKSFDDYPSLTAEPGKGNVWFILAGPQETISGEYHYYAVDEDQSSTYPIKTAQTAWDELNAGGGYIASLGANQEGNTVVIRRVYVAYYDPNVYTEFFQPIFVFEGDSGFVGYVPAVTSDYYGE